MSRHTKHVLTSLVLLAALVFWTWRIVGAHIWLALVSVLLAYVLGYEDGALGEQTWILKMRERVRRELDEEAG